MKKKIVLNETILVAGGSGMVGSAIIRKLNKNGYKKILFPTHEELDFLDINSVEKWFDINKPTLVIIAAAKVGGILANSSYPKEFILDNIKIQNNLIETSWQHKVKRLLFLGSGCIYPKFADQPIEEESLLTGQLEETNQWYAIAKISGIKLCEALRKQYKFDAISLMPSNLYGPGDNYHPENSHVLASFIRKFYLASKRSLPTVNCWGTGTPLREFLHVDDLAAAVLFTLQNWDPDGNNAPLDKNGNPLYFLNVGSGYEISIRDLAYKIKKITNFQGDIVWDHSKPDGTPRKLLNASKIKKLGWEPRIDLDIGIKKTLESFINQL